MLLKNADALFSLDQGDRVSKRELFDLIQLSKVEESERWSGHANVIHNTPQQGINWIGDPPLVRGVVIKKVPGAYKEDDWMGSEKNAFRYSLQGRNGNVSRTSKANSVLLNQPVNGYPIFFFSAVGSDWQFEGRFLVAAIDAASVILAKESGDSFVQLDPNDSEFIEGDKRLVTHLRIERNRVIVARVKQTREWVCEICQKDQRELYGFSFIEAHHKKPLGEIDGVRVVSEDDFALLCPNCHRAVHIVMRNSDDAYECIRETLIARLAENRR